MSGTQQIKAATADVTITDAAGNEWTFELAGDEHAPVGLALTVDREIIELPPTDGWRNMEGGPLHVSLKVRGQMRSRSEPAGPGEAEVTTTADLARGRRVLMDTSSGETREKPA